MQTVPLILKLLQFKLKLKLILPKTKFNLKLKLFSIQNRTSASLITNWNFKTIENCLLGFFFTLLLQGENAGVSMATEAVNFLKHLTNSDPTLNSPIRSILKKHKNGNSIVDAIMYKHEEFYEHLKSMHQLQVGI